MSSKTIVYERLHNFITIAESFAKKCSNGHRVFKESNPKLIAQYGSVRYEPRTNCLVLTRSELIKPTLELFVNEGIEFEHRVMDNGEQATVYVLNKDKDEAIKIAVELEHMIIEFRGCKLYPIDINAKKPTTELRKLLIRYVLDRGFDLGHDDEGVYLDPDEVPEHVVNNLLKACKVKVSHRIRGTYIHYPAKFKDFQRLLFCLDRIKMFNKLGFYEQLMVNKLDYQVTPITVSLLEYLERDIGRIYLSDNLSYAYARGLTTGYKMLRVKENIERNFADSKYYSDWFKVLRKPNNQYEVHFDFAKMSQFDNQAQKLLNGEFLHGDEKNSARVPVVVDVPKNHLLSKYLTPYHQGLLCQGTDGESYSYCTPFYASAQELAERKKVSMDKVNRYGVHYVVPNVLPYSELE